MAKETLSALWRQYEDFLEYEDTDQSWRKRYQCGVIALNEALGSMNGVPWGILQLLGGEAHGKTTLAYNFLAHAQRRGLKEVTLPNGRKVNAVFLDFERTYDIEYARINGVDTSKVLKIVTPFAEASFDIAIELLGQGIQFVIVDSIPALIVKSEEDKSMEDSPKIGDEAKVLGRGIKRMNALAYNADAFIILTNQWRANISPMAMTDKKPYGANILKHAVKYSIELSRIKRDANMMTISAFVAKTKAGANGRKIEYHILQGKGIDEAQHIISLAIDYGIVEKGGAWYYYPSKANAEYRVQGESNATKELPIELIRAQLIQEIEHEQQTPE